MSYEIQKKVLQDLKTMMRKAALEQKKAKPNGGNVHNERPANIDKAEGLSNWYLEQ